MGTIILTSCRTPPKRLAVNQTRTKRWLFHWSALLSAGKNLYESEWAREDSNLQPDRYERSALTIELRARRCERRLPIQCGTLRRNHAGSRARDSFCVPHVLRYTRKKKNFS